MENNREKFIRSNSPDGGFLQSEEWRRFQESVGRRVFCVPSPPAPLPSTGEGGSGFYASIIEHSLPIVGKYFYTPRGPIVSGQNGMPELIDLAKKEKAGWIRIEPATENILDTIRKNIKYKITKSPHDVQPKEIFIIDIDKSEEELLAGMKSKTRYNIRLAEKKGVRIRVIPNSKSQISNQIQNSQSEADPPSAENNQNKKYIEEFIRLVRVTAERDGIVSHPENYYRKMFETIAGEILKLYVAEYEGKIIAANLVLFYGGTCTYMHGASDNEHRNVMAPYLLQWRQIQDARSVGCRKYDFGGVSVARNKIQDTRNKQIQNSKFKIQNSSSWAGITRFKTGFSPKTAPTVFPGSYDIIINPGVYWLYRAIQRVKSLIKS